MKKNNSNSVYWHITPSGFDPQSKVDIQAFIHQGAYIAKVNFQKLESKEYLFHLFAEKFRFPDYFGNNWDAFEECLNDLSWLEFNSVLIFIEELLVACRMLDEKTISTFFSCLLNSQKAWTDGCNFVNGQKQIVPFHIFINCENMNAAQLQAILTSNNIKEIEI